ncbi:MAG TPA: bifunctional phosphoribosyl-AMP cyclohydrolase/phosphoribosyl-ATP diphosphatase HisIE [Polyangiaceae bacterium]|jgi:phosphoribosyl-ATP pyrophosphohydrolase/phosphoribosyl-AMP cyclohydrolase|nr:bifunctional phosphoribosyl-AMP cyclohydrolase/phosphoribosyl-ATP diphosphatase HisIE [Polyangiaceae bacterium]
MIDLSTLKKDAAGLVTVVAQDRLTGEVRMVAHANAEAVERTVSSGAAHFFSRSRNALWKKGETSGNVMRVHEVWLDCDADAVLYLVDPEGPTCHTGAPNCFVTRIDASAKDGMRATPLFVRLEEALEARKQRTGEKSYTRSLLDAGPEKIGAKIREEADELARAIASESTERVASEAADVLYHAMVGLLSRGVALRDVEVELARRFGVSGHDEKAARTK